MNKISIALLFALLGMAGCQKKIADTIDGQTPDQRLAAAMTAYQKQLTQAPNGWILIEATTGQAINQGANTSGPAAAFAYYMQFNDSNQVTMFSDFDTTTLIAKTSSYRLKATQRPSLIFDTYSYIHLPCDPNPAVSKSPFGPGLGWGTDFEFSFADNTSPTALGDTINLVGNLNSARAIMIKATKAQHDAYFNGTFAKDFVFAKIQNYFKNVTFGLKTFQFTPGIGNRIVDVSYLSGGTAHSVSTPFYQVADGIGFTTPITGNGPPLTGLTNIVWDPNTSTASVKVNGTAGTLAGAIAPLQYDPNGPFNWYFNALNIGGLYFSNNGFHVDGVDNAFRLDTLSFNGIAYSSYIYFPGFFNGGQVDLFAPVFGGNTLADYSNGTQPVEDGTGDGIVFFNLFTNGLPTPDAVTASNNLESDPNGFYMILKEDGTTYDQVITSDAKSWISWSFQP
jgi:Domain of unknown function (DUF4302)